MKYPFKYSGKKLIVYPFAKGVKGREPTRLTLMLDTGAEKTCIDVDAVERLGFDTDAIKPTIGLYSATNSCMVKVVYLKTFDLFGRKERNFPICVHAFPADFGTIQGVVGVDFLERLHKFKIDFDTHEIEVP